MNSWLGSLQCAGLRWRVFTGSKELYVPFAGRILTRAAPGGYDHCCQQEVVSLSSYRPIWQAVLDRELCGVAGMVRRLQSFGPRAVKQLRVDGVVAQIPRKGQARFLALNEETWPCGLRKFKAEKLPPNSRRSWASLKASF